MNFFRDTTPIDTGEILFVNQEKDEHVKIQKVFNSYTNQGFLLFYTKSGSYRNYQQTNRQKEFKQNSKRYTEFKKFCGEQVLTFEFDQRGNVEPYWINNKAYQPKEVVEKFSDFHSIYIVGSIGCGKSTYITSLVNEFDKKKQNSNFFIISIDVQTNILDKIKQSNYNKILFDFLKKEIENQISGYSVKANNLKKLWEELKSTFPANHIVFIFDGMDGIYDESIKLLFKNDDNSDHPWFKNSGKFTKQIIELRQTLEEHHNNIITIYALRPSTYRSIFSEINSPTSPNQEVNNKLTIFLDASSEKLQKKIINKRLDSLDCKYKEGYVKENLHNMISYAMKYSLHGLRHAINNAPVFLSKKSDKIYPEWMLNLFLFLDNKKTYTQDNNTGIANIFLVNSACRARENDKAQGLKYPDIVTKCHKHTYWLKYFIIANIHADNPYFNHEINFEYDDRYNEHFSSYEKHIYLLCLYSLSEIHHGRLVTNHTEISQDFHSICHIKSTKRLNKLFDAMLEKQDYVESIFFSFIYLAVIVDDNWLLFPSFLKVKIQNGYSRHTYKNIFPNTNSETEDWRGWLKKSIFKVLLFVQLLEISLEYYEKKLLDAVFYERHKPNFSKIKESIEKEILEIGRSLDVSDEYVQGLLKQKKQAVLTEQEETIRFFKKLAVETTQQE